MAPSFELAEIIQKIKKIFSVLGVRGGERQYMMGMQGQPARADSFLSA